MKSIECRNRDLVIRIADWTKDKYDPGYDVELYIHGAYNSNESKCFTVHQYGSLPAANAAVVAFVQAQVEKLA